MIHTNFLNSFINQEVLQNSNFTHLKPGQIFQAKVIKLFPNQSASIRMGGFNIHAKLDAALTTNKKYWFQVQSNKETLELKVVEKAGNSQPPNVDKSSNPKMSNQQLLASMGIPKTKINQQLLDHLIKNQTPFKKEELIKAHSFLKETENQQKGIHSVQLMLSKGLLFSKQVFQSIYAVQEDQQLSQQILDVKNLLMPLAKENMAADQLVKLVTEMFQTNKEVDAPREILSLLKRWLSNENDSGIQTLLEKIGAIPKGFSRANFIETLKTIFQNSEQLKHQLNRQEVNLLSTGSPVNQEKTFISLFLSKFENMENNFQKTMLLETLINMVNNEKKGNRVIQTLRDLNPNVLQKQFSKEEMMILKEIRSDAVKMDNRVPMEMLSVKEITNHLKKMFNTLGLQFEHDLLRNQNTENQRLQSLKPLLLNLVQQEGFSTPVKDELRHLLHRITGQQLIAQDQSGPLQHIMMQVPLQIGNKFTDLSIQWEGKQTENGQIDPDYCRIIFYLDLESIKETMIDVQVQNRIIHIQIMNELPEVKALVRNMESILKEKFSAQNYKLSGISVLNHFQNETPSFTSHSTPYNYQSYSGVDYRI